MSNHVEELKKDKNPLDVWDDLIRYSKTGYDTITPDDMTRFRWYGIYQQQPKDGHFMMRVKIPGGDISSAQWRLLAEIAGTYGGSVADITTRQNIQFHWLTIDTIPDVIRMLDTQGLSTVGACGDITRNIAGCPVAGIDPDEIYDCREIIGDITAYFQGTKEFSDLPRKYKMTIGGCQHQCHQPQINDVGITAVQRHKDGKWQKGFEIRVGGGLSTQPHLASKLDIFVLPEQVAEVVRAITEIFRDEGYRSRRNHARLKFLVADWGAVKFKEELVKRLGWTPEPAISFQNPAISAHQDHIGIHKQRQAGLNWIGVSIVGGRVSAEQMIAAANIADKYCLGNLRTTNQQNLLFPNIANEDLVAAQEEIRAAGFEWNVSAFQRGSIACTGTEFCNLAITETKGRLREIITHLQSTLVWDETLRINVNGCPNSCGQHHVGDIGLQGCLAKVGDEKVEAYDICLGGRLGENAKFTRAIERKVPAVKVKYALENLLRAFQITRKDNEKFTDFVDRHTNDELGGFLGVHLLAETDPDFVAPPPRCVPASVEG